MSNLNLLIQPLKAVWNKSWTKFWAWVQVSSSAVLYGLSELNNYVSDTHFKDYLSNFDIPKWTLVALASVGFITWLAHGRENDD